MLIRMEINCFVRILIDGVVVGWGKILEYWVWSILYEVVVFVVYKLCCEWVKINYDCYNMICVGFKEN